MGRRASTRRSDGGSSRSGRRRGSTVHCWRPSGWSCRFLLACRRLRPGPQSDGFGRRRVRWHSPQRAVWEGGSVLGRGRQSLGFDRASLDSSDCAESRRRYEHTGLGSVSNDNAPGSAARLNAWRFGSRGRGTDATGSHRDQRQRTDDCRPRLVLSSASGRRCPRRRPGTSAPRSAQRC